MLRSYFQNSDVSMTKDTYFEMCEMLGTEPNEDEIPIEFDDFPTEIQETMGIYYRLRDEWDTMNGIYTGKSFVGLSDILDILEVEHKDRKYVLEWISTIDSIRSKILNKKETVTKPK